MLFINIYSYVECMHLLIHVYIYLHIKSLNLFSKYFIY